MCWDGFAGGLQKDLEIWLDFRVVEAGILAGHRLGGLVGAQVCYD